MRRREDGHDERLEHLIVMMRSGVCRRLIQQFACGATRRADAARRVTRSVARRVWVGVWVGVWLGVWKGMGGGEGDESIP